jgi:hypothetical protein
MRQSYLDRIGLPGDEKRKAIFGLDLKEEGGIMEMAVSSTVTACRPGGADESDLVKPLVGQEPNATDSVGIGG